MRCLRICCAIGLLLLLASAATAEVGPNLLSNAALADPTGKGVPDGWQALPGGNGRTTWLSVVKDEDGGVAVKIIDHDGTVGVGVSQRVAGQAGRQYAFSAETNGGSTYLFLRFYDAKGNVIQPEYSVMTPETATWRRWTKRAAAPAGTAAVMAWVYTTSTLQTELSVRKPELRDEGEPVALQGPLTTDQAFFDALNLDFPGMEAVKTAVARKDYPAAAEAYLAFRRTKSKAKWRINPAEKPVTAVVANDAAGDRVLQHLIAMPWGNDMNPYQVGEKIDWLFNPRKLTDPSYTIEWTYIALNRSYQWSILADAYWKTLDEKYAREWVAELESWVKDNPVPEEAGPGDTVTWRTIEAGIRMNEVWPDVYYHFLPSPAFTPAAHLLYAKSCLEHAQRLQRILRDYPKHGGNWVTMEANGLCTVGVLFPEWKTSAGFVADAFARMDKELTAQVYPDGGQVELSCAYHQVSMVNFMGLVTIAKTNDVPIPADYLSKLKAMYAWDLGLMDQDGLMPPANDETPPTRVTRVLAEAHAIWGDPEFAFGSTLGKEGKMPPLSSFFPYSGYYAMRGGWQRNDLYLFFDAGPVGMGHWHEDMLNLYLRAFGKPLLTEAGGYAYDQSPMRSYVLGTTAHNCITVDGKQQHRGTGSPPPMVPAKSLWSTSPLYDYAAGTYDAGYQTSRYEQRAFSPIGYTGPRDTSVTHTRHLFFLKPYCVVAVDELAGAGAHRYDAYFHLDAPDATIDDATRAVQTARKDGVQLGLFPLEIGDLQVRKVIGQQDPPLGWIAWPHRAIPTIIYTRQAPAPALFATLLYPYRGEQPQVTATPLTITAGQTWAVQLDTPRERVILSLQRAQEPATITLPGGVVTDARAVVIRRPAAAAWLGLEGLHHLRMAGMELAATEACALVLAPTEPTKLLLYNAGQHAVTVDISQPCRQSIRLKPQVWVEVTEKGSATPEQAPGFMAGL